MHLYKSVGDVCELKKAKSSAIILSVKTEQSHPLISRRSGNTVAAQNILLNENKTNPHQSSQTNYNIPAGIFHAEIKWKTLFHIFKKIN